MNLSPYFFVLGSRQEITYPKFGLVIFSDSKARRRRIAGSVTDEQRCYLEKEQYKWVGYFLPAPLPHYRITKLNPTQSHCNILYQIRGILHADAQANERIRESYR